MSMQTTDSKAVLINNILFQQIEKLKPKKNYKDYNKAIEEVLLVGIESLREEAEDEYLLELVMERKKNDTGVRYTEEEIMREFGITEEDLENMEDVELEYEI